MLALMSPQVMRSVWGRRREEKSSEPGERITLLPEQSGTSLETIETISLAISDSSRQSGGEARAESGGTDKVTRVTNEARKLSSFSLASSYNCSKRGHSYERSYFDAKLVVKVS